MSALLTKDGKYELPADGWYQLAALGEIPHAESGLVQVVDAGACDAMAAAFREAAQATNFAGLLVDFDHFSLDGGQRSEAAGWIVALEGRTDEGGAGNAGLWGQIRWSDVGEAAVRGGRYRFISPVWRREDCEDLGDGRVRPLRLLNAAVTNDPNMKGMRPLSNRKTVPSDGVPLAKAGGPVVNYRWVMSDGERHCPSCEALAGQVHTMAEWEAAGVKPKSSKLYCQGNCHCRFEPTTEASAGAVVPGPLRNRWSDAARQASLEVRRSKAKARLNPTGAATAAKVARMSQDGAMYRQKAAQGSAAGSGLREAHEAARGAQSDDVQARVRLAIEQARLRARQPAKPAPANGEARWIDPVRRDGTVRSVSPTGPDGGRFNERTGQREKWDPIGQRWYVKGQRFKNREDTRMKVLENIGWTDEARAASLAVRRAKAAARRSGGSGHAFGTGSSRHARSNEQRAADDDLDRKRGAVRTDAWADADRVRSSDAYRREVETVHDWADRATEAYRGKYGREPATDGEIAQAEQMAGVPAAYRTNGEPVTAEVVADRILMPMRGEVDPSIERDPGARDDSGGGVPERMLEPMRLDPAEQQTFMGFLERVMSGETLHPEEVTLMRELERKARGEDDGGIVGAGGGAGPDGLRFNEETGHREMWNPETQSWEDVGLGDGDPAFQEQERESMRRVREAGWLDGLDDEEVAAQAREDVAARRALRRRVGRD